MIKKKRKKLTKTFIFKFRREYKKILYNSKRQWKKEKVKGF